MSSDGIPLLELAIPFAGIVGLFVGSFLNVVVYRAPRHLSVSTPRSFCPNCRRQLTWWENIPLFSWVGLRGRCHGCKDPISIRYPLVEVTTGVAFCLITWALSGEFVAVAYCVLAATMIAVSLIEYGGERSPTSVAVIGSAVGLVLLIPGAWLLHDWWIAGGSLISVGAATCALYLIHRWSTRCPDPRQFGSSALLLAGCWAGGLGVAGIAVAAGAGIVTFLSCQLYSRSELRSMAGDAPASITESRSNTAVLKVPMITSLLMAMAIALLAIR